MPILVPKAPSSCCLQVGGAVSAQLLLLSPVLKLVTHLLTLLSQSDENNHHICGMLAKCQPSIGIIWSPCGKCYYSHSQTRKLGPKGPSIICLRPYSIDMKMEGREGGGREGRDGEVSV